MFFNKDGALDLKSLGEQNARQIHLNYSVELLYEEILKRREGKLAKNGCVVVNSCQFSQISPENRYIVKNFEGENYVWLSDNNQVMDEDKFQKIFNRMIAYAQNKEFFVQHLYAANNSNLKIPIRIITETARHSLYSKNIFTPIDNLSSAEQIENSDEILFSFVHIPGFNTIPDIDGTKSQISIIKDLKKKVVFICGTDYAGEIRQAVFSILNYIYGKQSVLTLRCSSNIGEQGDVALFLGQSGAGKTTVAIDPDRKLIGDHEHCWTDSGIVSLLNGCYINASNMTNENQPEIFSSINRYGAMIENAPIDNESRELNIENDNFKLNIKASFPLSFLPNINREEIHSHPKNIFHLACDKSGVFPIIARLSLEQAIFSFISSYAFSTFEMYNNNNNNNNNNNIDYKIDICSAISAFLLNPKISANLLINNIKKHNVKCWLINTGWIGEPMGKSDQIKISYVRAAINAAISGALDNVSYDIYPVFQFEVPKECPAVPSSYLNPITLAGDQIEFSIRAHKLAEELINEYSKFENEMPEEISKTLSILISNDQSLHLENFGFSM